MASSTSSSPLPWDVQEEEEQPAAQGDGGKESQAEGGGAAPAASSSNGARRTKAMSIGNAASLFGAPASPANGSPSAGGGAETTTTASASDFLLAKRSSPVVSKGSAFASIGEEAEPPATGDAGDAANLFSSLAAVAGGNDSEPPAVAAMSDPVLDWLGGAQQPAQDTQTQPQYYAAGQPSGYTDAASNGGDALQQQQYAYYDQNAYAGQQQQSYGTQQYAYDNSTVNGMYVDPSGQQAYQANLQAQAHSAQQPNAYTQPYDSLSSGYYQQPQSAYQPSYQPQQYAQAGAYDPNSQYLGMPQQQAGSQQMPYTAPAGAAYANQMAYSQSQGPLAGSSAPIHAYAKQSEVYDPYAPSSSNDPYAAQQSSSKPALVHSMTQPASAHANNAYDPYGIQQPNIAPPQLVHSATSAAITTMGSKQGSEAAAKHLNRTKSSFFAELPPMPAPKSRPPSSMSNVRAGGSSGPVPPVPPMSAGSPKIPPPPKSRTPAPFARPGSAASVSRPASRTAQRQGSLASSAGGRASVDHSAQYASYPVGDPNYAQSATSSSTRQSLDGNYVQTGVYADPRAYATSPPPQQQYQGSRYSIDSTTQSHGRQSPYQQQQTVQPSAYQHGQATQQYSYAQPPDQSQQGQYQNGPYGPTQTGYMQSRSQEMAGTSQSMHEPYDRPQFERAGHSASPYNDYSAQRAQSPPQVAPARQVPPPIRKGIATRQAVSPQSSHQALPPTAIDIPLSDPLASTGITRAAPLQEIQQENDADTALESITTSIQNYSIDQSAPARQREETTASSVSIAQTHEEVDELPVHAQLAAAQQGGDSFSTLEPYERSITLDAYLPPTPGSIGQPPATDPSTVSHVLDEHSPLSDVASLSSGDSAAPGPITDVREFTPLQEKEAELELQMAERDLDRQLFAEDGGELDMLVDQERRDSGMPASSSYDNAYDPYGYSSQSVQHHVSSQPYHPAPQVQDTYAGYSNGPFPRATQEPYVNEQHYDPYSIGNEQPYSNPLTHVAQAIHPNANLQTSAHDPYSSMQTYETMQSEQPPQATQAYDPYATQSGDASVEHLANGHAKSDATRPPVPAVSFGFNGRLVTFFPSLSSSYTSSGASSYVSPYGGPSPSASGSSVTIRRMSELLTSDAATLEAFPGPLFMDQGAVSGAGKTKKRKDVVAWLDARIEEAEKEASYISSVANDPRKREAEEKCILHKLVKIMLEHDGKLSGNGKIDDSVRAVLVPGVAAKGHSSSFPTATDLKHDTAPDTGGASASDADLDAIQSCLLRGDKPEALRYALDRRLWAHALVISASLDETSYATAVREFAKSELRDRGIGGREPLRVTYSLLSGAGVDSLEEFLPLRKLAAEAVPSFAGVSRDPYAPSSRSATPMPGSGYPTDVPAETLAKWRETAAMIIANGPKAGSQTLASLGDVLAANGWLKAAHACYLLSGPAAVLGGPGMPGVRYTLIGANHALQTPTASRDIEAIMLTEVVEFALSFVPVAKGQESYIGLPYLQGYRTMHALELSDIGMHSSAQKYCDALGATLKLATKASPFYHPALLAQIKDLSDRLSSVSFQDKSGSWISRKVQRPTLDNVWSTLEGRFTKFVAGEAEEDPTLAARKKAKQDAAKGVAGPFAHYSSITPTGFDSLSRNASSTDLSMRATPPPQSQPTSAPNTVTRTGTVKQTHHRRSSSYGYGPYGADPYPPYMNTMPDTVEEAETSMEAAEQAGQTQNIQSSEPQYGYVTPQNDTGWWSSANGGQNDSPYGGSSGYGQQPQMYSPIAEGDYAASDPSGLMSPMAYQQSSPMTASSSQTQYGGQSSSLATSSTLYDDDDDELGLGNSANKKVKDKLSASEPPSSKTPKEDAPAKKEEQTVRPVASSSWLGRIFRREGGSPQQGSGPIKAKLGEETSFVYDPVEKRWVNKKAGSDTPPPAPVVPPPRAQTASPSTAARGSFASQLATPPAPVMRASTASPPVLLQASAPPAAATPPPPPTGATPPPPRPSTTTTSSAGGELPPPPKKPAGGGAARKNVRNRYVDVFAQQQQGKS